MNKQMIRDSLILFAITLIAGLLLGGVYAITKNPIAKTQEDKKNEAYQAVFTDAAEFTEVTDAADAQQILADAGYTKDRIDEVKAAMDADGNILGYVMTITSSEAYGGELQLAMGIRMDGTVNGISFLSLSETIGLGMEAKKPEFQEQFAGKQVEQFVYSKTGAAADNEIDALSGATITTNAVTNAVNAGICYAGALGAGSAEQGGDTDE
ncbi:electron transport complex RnfABCDGE type D subunit [Clostridium sp. CAG:632]|jgi:RnfABCDGE-type electron transport complex G subunit|nr:RnfABCDGE type electron transport complex subunit G [Lachnospiraceae bacterium]MBS6466859.1 RnfABCDGE type electron transport complex subunit G [Clostridium sp.]MDD6266543.1 RnfABCDGE type electron transport complex subunit G [Clostridium sp.]CCY58951.1 electron transport complex RnfABCDGE type D subunit [Clostridium sp. CAG:632]